MDYVINGEAAPDSASLIIFGATGELATAYLFPALNNLCRKGWLANNFKIIGVGRRPFTQEQYIEFINNAFHANQKLPGCTNFVNKIKYFKANFEDGSGFQNLAEYLNGEHPHADLICGARLFYFATLPKFFESLSKNLKEHDLLKTCKTNKQKIRVLIEKPFGESLKTAKSLNNTLLTFFKEEQIYRIDHYLGKETVQNIFTVRFANDIFEPIWNNKYIDHVEISALESEGVGGRINFYNETGAIKDFVQNHLLNVLALLAMDKPESLNSDAIRNKKVKVLKSLRPYTKQTIQAGAVRAQYAAGIETLSYAAEVGAETQTETFAAFKVELRLPKWRGVPFYIRTGKRLSRKTTEVSVHFKKAKHELFIPNQRASNVLTFCLQPEESVSLSVNNKIPGFGTRLHSGKLNFGYEDFKAEIPGAYERLLLDFIQGDQRLFIRSDEIELAWNFTDSLMKYLPGIPMHSYPPFSEGPKASEELIQRDKRDWWTK